MSYSSVYSCIGYGITGLIALLTACHRPLPPASPDEIAELIILLDSSTVTGTKRKLDQVSAKREIAELRCPEAAHGVYQILSRSGVDHLSVAVLQTGESKDTGGEPIPLIPWAEFSFTEHVFGKKVSREEEVTRFLADLDKRCRDTIRPTASSPILLGFQRLHETLEAHAEDLRRQGKLVSSQSLLVASDLRERTDLVLRTRIQELAKALSQGKALPPRPAQLPPLELGKVSVQICGLSSYEADAEDTPYSGQATSIAWRELFNGTAPPFGAVCPRYQAPSATAAPTEVQP